MTSLKHTFDKNAEDYSRYRPGYPKALADDITDLASLKAEARILEIGCGAGQATGLFLDLNPRQTSIDIGPRLVEQCRTQFGDLPNYEFVISAFEDYEDRDSECDLIYAATCFHWLKPGVRYSKAYGLLKPDGHLAVFSDKHCKNRDGFFAEVQECYRQYAPELVPTSNDSVEKQNQEEVNPLTLIASREYDRDLRYTADEYVGLLRTFSGHIALGENRLRALCNSIHQLIIQSYGGVVTKTLTTRLKLYRKAEQGAQPDAYGAG